MNQYKGTIIEKVSIYNTVPKGIKLDDGITDDMIAKNPDIVLHLRLAYQKMKKEYEDKLQRMNDTVFELEEESEKLKIENAKLASTAAKANEAVKKATDEDKIGTALATAIAEGKVESAHAVEAYKIQEQSKRSKQFMDIAAKQPIAAPQQYPSFAPQQYQSLMPSQFSDPAFTQYPSLMPSSYPVQAFSQNTTKPTFEHDVQTTQEVSKMNAMRSKRKE